MKKVDVLNGLVETAKAYGTIDKVYDPMKMKE